MKEFLFFIRIFWIMGISIQMLIYIPFHIVYYNQYTIADVWYLFFACIGIVATFVACLIISYPDKPKKKK